MKQIDKNAKKKQAVGVWSQLVQNKYGLIYKIIIKANPGHGKIHEVSILDKNGRDVDSKKVEKWGELLEFVHKRTSVWLAPDPIW